MCRHLGDEQIVHGVPDRVFAGRLALGGGGQVARRIEARGGNVRRDRKADVVEQARFQRAVVIQGNGQIQYGHEGGAGSHGKARL